MKTVIQKTNIKKQMPLILLVDDMPANLSVVKRVLEHAGFNILIATNGIEALTIIESRIPDIILLDIMMPEMDGFEVCRRIKSNPELEDIPIFFLTSKMQSQDIITGFNLGAVDYIMKPYNVHEVIARINTHLKIKNKIVCQAKAIDDLIIQNKNIQAENEKLKKINENKDKFFSIIAHDIKNPFQGFLGLTELLVTELNNFSKEDIQEMITQMYNSSHNLHKLLDNLLTWSRIQMKIIVFRPMPQDLYDLVNNTFSLFLENANAKKIKLINTLEQPTVVIVDKQMMEIILQNIVSNSIKYSNENTEIIINSEIYDDVFKIIIKDNGIGMSPEVKERLFKVYQNKSTRGTSKETGTGLGMIIVKSFLDEYGAKIDVESEVGSGSKFILTFPIKNKD